MDRLPTIEDVARAAQVSRQTVSNVLNTPAIVKPATRKRVEVAIRKLAYRPHASARRLRMRKSSTIAIRLDPMTNGISGALLDRFLHALTEQADDRGIRILLFTAADPAAEIEQIRKLRASGDVDAFVLTATFHGDPRTKWLVESDVPFVTFGRPWGADDMNHSTHLWVDVDGFAGMREATIHLIDRGSSRIGYVGWPSPSGTGDDRHRGWQTAVGERLALGDDDLTALNVSVEDRLEDARNAVVTLLEGDDRIDGLVCASDTLALGAMIAAASVGRSDLPIIGFDNSPVGQAIGLSSVDQTLDAVAGGALELLLGESGSDLVHRDAASGDARHRLITPHLVIRQPLRLLAPDAVSTPTATKNAVGNHRNGKETQ
ncbi:LacI family DNA-binding transcriptional regulator [Cryobacterium psychrophilum]|uniref:LacI family transcriptional regulator n=1 Tax=Cryobacterium psychrophilum TaxID=41988 RepID=A0A4Y8KU36_9MICO|nr:LacI family DNA-binding transcriptional regulator [Cryobacterium psychrophilum]TDW30331.1 LacI family transcriptional regulator [Cryobacterium psychrophilum]TFD79030.1 LacI family transcriptional regulator [Cryobacterium psychrophilum]